MTKLLHLRAQRKKAGVGCLQIVMERLNKKARANLCGDQFFKLMEIIPKVNILQFDFIDSIDKLPKIWRKQNSETVHLLCLLLGWNLAG